MKFILNSFVLFLLVILSSVIVIAQPPFTDVQTSNCANCLNILYPKILYYENGKDFILNFHVLNATGSILDNTTTECILHFYDNTGVHLFRNELLYFNGDFYYNMSGTLIQDNGEYAYNVWCTNSQVGGFTSGEIIVTTSGNENEDNYLEIAGILMFVICFMFFIGYKFKLLYFDNAIGETPNNGVSILQYLFWLVGGWLIVALINVAVAASNNISVVLSGTLKAVYSAVLWPMYLLTALFLIGFVFAVLEWLNGQARRLK